MGVELAALNTVNAVVGVHDEQHLIRIGYGAVIIFIPQHDDGAAALAPDRRVMDSVHDGSQGNIALINQCWV